MQVFVYGTLMPGRVRWRHLRPFAEQVLAATARGRMWDTGDDYPAVVFGEHEGAVDLPGVVVALVPERVEEAIALLDRIEDQGVLYRRLEVTTSAGAAQSYEWLGSTEGLTELPRGWQGP